MADAKLRHHMIDEKATGLHCNGREKQLPEELVLPPVENGAGSGIGCAAIVAALIYWDHSGKTAAAARQMVPNDFGNKGGQTLRAR